MKIKTTVLQALMVEAVKGASNNKIIPITGLVSVEVKDKTLTLTTTDANNYLKLFQAVEEEDFEAVVSVDLFSKLVAKTNTKEIELTIKDQTLEVKGNGVYKIPMPIDEEGNTVHFPDRAFDEKKATKVVVSEKAIKSVLESNKPSVAISVEIPYLTGYYFEAEKVVSTNAFVVCVNNEKVFDEPILLPADFVELLPIIGDKEVDVFISEKNVYAVSKAGSIHGYQLDGLNDFPITNINEYFETEFKYSASIKKENLTNVLDRMNLFVDDYDKNAININFKKDGIEFSSRKATGVEVIPYEETSEVDEYEVTIDIALLISQLNGHSKDIIEIHYGNDRAIKISGGKVVHLIALFEGE